MVVTGHPVAADAGAKVLREGGNAVDAAVATALMLGVVDGHNSGIGGGCFMLIRLADGTLVALDGREMAPAAAHRDMFIRDGEADTRLSQTGPLASGIPGSLAVYDHALREYGSRTLAELLLPAALVAEEGFEVNRAYAGRLRSVAGDLRRFEASRRMLLKEDGQPYGIGEILRLPELGQTYRAIAEDGIDWFYKGPFAQKVEQWMGDNGGIITAEDFANYDFKQREPIVTRYRGYTIVGFPPPSSGGVHVAQVLNMLEHFDVAALHEQDPAGRVHVMAEAMKLAFADRAHWLGDPDFADVPRGLVDEAYARALAGRIDPERTIAVEAHGTPPRAEEDLFARAVDGAADSQKHTVHISAADAEGNWVAITATVNTAFGSKVVIPGTGVVMNNQMDDFSVQPGVPNHFGLVGAEANAVAPGKRPLSSMSPTIVLKDDQPVLTLGAAGGPRIITQVLAVISNVVDLGDDLETAMARPRFHHQWLPDRLWIERAFDEPVLERLRKMGHELDLRGPAGATHAIATDTEMGEFIGVPDPRGQGKAAGE